MKSFGVVLGSSATGKGTRMNQLMQFLNTKYTPEIFEDTDKDGKKFNLGLLYKELDILILGKYVNNVQTGISSWSSMDSIWSKYGGTEPTVARIKELHNNVICEGYANMDTFRIRPAHMSSNGCKNFFYQLFYYDKNGIQDYLNRVIGRSGKEPKGTTAFEKNGAVLSWEPKILKDISENNLTGICQKYLFDADIDTIGKEYLKFLGLNDLANEFVEYTKENKFFKEFKPQETGEDW